MVSTWGGPDIPPNSTNQPQPVFAGFDQFAITNFAPLSWAIPSSPGFRIADPTGRKVVFEIAALQQEIRKKTGRAYEETLRQQLMEMGADEGQVETYISKLRGDPKQFKDFLVTFLVRGG